MSSYLYYVLPALGGYTLTSLYLLKNPQVLHGKKCVAFRCRHISHRGGSGERIESTMEAFTHYLPIYTLSPKAGPLTISQVHAGIRRRSRLPAVPFSDCSSAVEAGTEMLELDCHMTKDGYVIVSHDENLLRQTGVDVNISSVNFEELPLYKERLEVTFHDGHFSTGTDRKFALLEDVFRAFPKVPINIEIKEDNDELIKKVSSLVKEYDREKITVWASVKSLIMDKCRKENPEMPYMFTVRRGLQLLLFYYCGLLPFLPLGESFLQFYLPQVYNRKGYGGENETDVSFCSRLTMRRSLFRHLAKRGIQVHLFVCNNTEDIEAAFAFGATGVMTDYPSLLSEYLRSHPPKAVPCVEPPGH
ncbi:glycerophosphodiester phosphodiesterase domain-containing protein 3-like [Scleropages formosus]|uniref:Glycerophosphodiester phosphodiesterase domain-containing protein 3-like n=1 Tax=Scleropages formosus TaxID=113540 RepID=A0A0P7UHD3_SCLFO|nr:glycerophosphodiester phosphodiesterase domain-containing protein 3-like [Scleropages formosus]